MTWPEALIGAIRRPLQQGEGPRAIRPRGLAEMDFIAVERRPGGHVGAGDAGERLVRQERGLDVQQAKALDASGAPSRPLRVVRSCAPASGSRRTSRAPARRAGHGP